MDEKRNTCSYDLKREKPDFVPLGAHESNTCCINNPKKEGTMPTIDDMPASTTESSAVKDPPHRYIHLRFKFGETQFVKVVKDPNYVPPASGNNAGKAEDGSLTKSGIKILEVEETVTRKTVVEICATETHGADPLVPPAIIQGDSDNVRCRTSSNTVLSSGKPVMAENQLVVNKVSNKVLELSKLYSCYDNAEQLLKDVIDSDGEISKQKESIDEYMEILSVAASSEDVKCEVVRSTRNISIILEALLKTQSQCVLKEIVNNQGLQMLHTIIKQNYLNLNRTPILRKCMKILSHLAEKGLMRELITSGITTPSGKDSFRELIFELANHSDVQIHQAARNFRDKWMPQTFSRNQCPPDRGYTRAEQKDGHQRCRDSASKGFWDHDSRPMAEDDTRRYITQFQHPAYGTQTHKRKLEEGSSGSDLLEHREDRTTRQTSVPSLQHHENKEVVQHVHSSPPHSSMSSRCAYTKRQYEDSDNRSSKRQMVEKKRSSSPYFQSKGRRQYNWDRPRHQTEERKRKSSPYYRSRSSRQHRWDDARRRYPSSSRRW